MTREELERLGISYESGIVYHTTARRGKFPLKRHVQNVKDNVYYYFKINGKSRAIREEKIIEAFKEEE